MHVKMSVVFIVTMIASVNAYSKVSIYTCLSISLCPFPPLFGMHTFTDPNAALLNASMALVPPVCCCERQQGLQMLPLPDMVGFRGGFAFGMWPELCTKLDPWPRTPCQDRLASLTPLSCRCWFPPPAPAQRTTPTSFQATSRVG